jgi:hypothetical protein
MQDYKAFPNLREVEAAGLQSVSESQLIVISLELQLPEVARQVATQYGECPRQTILEIGKSAPIRALSQAVCRFEQEKFQGDLGEYLVNATGAWAALMAQRYMQGGGPIPIYGLEQALKEEVEFMATTTTFDEASPRTSDANKTDVALTSLERALQAGGLRTTRCQNEVRFGLLAGDVACDCVIIADARAVCLYVHLPIFVPAHRRSAVCEALAIANWQLLFGDFEMDPADGQVRFRSILPMLGGVTDEHIDMFIGTTVNAMRRYASVICELALTDTDAKVLMAQGAEPGRAATTEE